MSNVTPIAPDLAPCWFSERPASGRCECGRTYSSEYGFGGRCMICALALGLYDQERTQEMVSNHLIYGLSHATGDPYIVIPPVLNGVAPLSLPQVERLLSVLVKMVGTDNPYVRARAVRALAATTNSWPSMNPSALVQHKQGTSLLAADQVRRWLVYALKSARSSGHEAIMLAILDKLRTADFRDVHSNISGNMKSLSFSNTVSRVKGVFDGLEEMYPFKSALANERCELLAYEQYNNRTRGAGETMERLYGPLLKYSITLGKMLKKGTWLSSHARYEEWYYGQGEPV